MNTNDPNILQAVRSKNLFQIEFIDMPGNTPIIREQFIAFIMKDKKFTGGVKFAISPFKVNYRYPIETDSNGTVIPFPLYNLVGVHFIVPVNVYEDHLNTFLHKIRKGCNVTFTVSVNQEDDRIFKLGLEKHLLTARIGSDTYLIASWVGKPENAPVQYPRSGNNEQVSPDFSESCSCDASIDFSSFCNN